MVLACFDERSSICLYLRERPYHCFAESVKEHAYRGTLSVVKKLRTYMRLSHLDIVAG